MPLLICGYRRHGKNFLYSRLKSGLIKGLMSNYYLYAKDGSSLPTFLQIIESPTCRDVSLAWPIKERVGKRLGLSAATLDLIKDQPVKDPDSHNFQYVRPSSPMIYRDLLREVAAQGRYNDPDYWTKISIRDCLAWDSVVTDLRYPNEFTLINAYFPGKTVTLRVHFSEADIPSYDDLTEHSLDNFMTDFIASDISFLKEPTGYTQVTTAD